MRVRRWNEAGAIEAGAEIIRSGGLVAFPTETVYGLGADACNERAVARVFECKRRPSFDPLIVHVPDAESARRYGDFSHPAAPDLTERFWPGPLTLVVPKTGVIPGIVTSGLDTVAIRVPGHPAALALLKAAGIGIAAPSANPFGYVSPTTASHVADLLPDIDLILDGGRCDIGLESTILSLATAVPAVLRLGGLPLEELEQLLGALPQPGPTLIPAAPGQLVRHYATRVPLVIVAGEASDPGPARGEKAGLLTLTPPSGGDRGYAAVEVLSHSGDMREAAANLFSALRRLDRLGLDRVVAYAVAERGLGLAIMDRLRRCAARE